QTIVLFFVFVGRSPQSGLRLILACGSGLESERIESLDERLAISVARIVAVHFEVSGQHCAQEIPKHEVRGWTVVQCADTHVQQVLGGFDRSIDNAHPADFASFEISVEYDSA